MDKLAHINLEKVCRLCLTESQEARSIFNEIQTNSFNLNIQQLLIKIVDIELSDPEELPNIVCEKCLQFLVEISKFVQICLNSDKVIQAYYSEFRELKMRENEVTLNVKEELYQDENCDDNFNEDLRNNECNPNKLAIAISEKSENHFKYYLQTRDCGGMEYACNLCPSHFKFSNDFKEHIVTHGEEPYVCNSCRKPYRLYQHLSSHLESPNSNKINKTKPGKLFKNYKTGLRYYLQFQECGNETHVCNICSQRFIESSDFRIHLTTHGEEPYVCNECRKTFTTYNHLLYHIRKHLSVTNDETMKKTKKLGSYYLETLENGEQIYTCNLCEARFDRLKELNLHMPSHGDKPYWCSDCKKGFASNHLLIGHIKRHNSSARYNCELCDKSYREKSSLIIHQRKHRGERPYLCSTCGKSFTATTDLKIHSSCHSDERKHMCTYCGLKFKAKKTLVEHVRSHTGEKPYKCSECPKEFSRSTKLNRHRMTHTGLKPFVCNICQKAFNRNSNLQTHIKSHSDYRPHICKICQRGFTQAHSLRTHMLIHAKERNK